MLCAALAAVVGFCTWRALAPGGGIRFAPSTLLVDVATGELFEFRFGGGRTLSVPARHPRTGVRSLLPVREENGRWFIGSRELAGLSKLAVAPGAVLSLTTGEVRAFWGARAAAPSAGGS
ncbi:MAG: hypothetical protein IT437_12285 [Phycisphaerales bacterium]|nr:hypothetical protein [Phycisphaerales bacterium]